MSKKHHKLHRHRHPSKIKLHRKLRKELASESVLEPIHEISKEKLKVDKNGCGDHLHSAERREKPKHSRNKNEDGSIIDKNHVKKRKKSAKEKSVRHQSLEKNESRLLDKAKVLFRKEKSFNDAIQRTATDLKCDKTCEALEKNNKERKHKHHHRKETNINKTTINGADRTITEPGPPNMNKRKHKSKEKQIQIQSQNMNRIQEVIYCHMTQNPYEMKNDKNADQVKDLYRRLKRENRKAKEENGGTTKHRSYTHTDDHAKSSRKYNKEEHNKARSKTPKTTTDRNDTRKNRLDSSHRERNRPEQKNNISPTREKHKNNMNAINLGPYEKYFAFEKKCHHEHCKRHRKEENKSKSAERKENRQELRHDEKKDKIIEEEKIHQIVERDLKNHFDEIQILIDKKLDVVLQSNKEKREARKKAKELEGKKTKQLENNNKDVEEKNKLNNKSDDKTNMNLAKEEIIKEVLKRLKQESQQNIKQKDEERKSSKFLKNEELKSDKAIKEKHESKDQNNQHQGLFYDRINSEDSANNKGHNLITNPVDSHKLNLNHDKRNNQNIISKKVHNSGNTESLQQKFQEAKDSLECIKFHLKPPLKLAIPLENKRHVNKTIFDNKAQQKDPYLTLLPWVARPCASMSSCKTFSEHFTDNNRKNRIAVSPHRGPHPYQMYSASEENIRSNKFEEKQEKRKDFIQNKHQNYICSNCNEPTNQFKHRHHQQFVVQGIEPPILEHPVKAAKKNVRDRKFECKTVSIIAIPPHVGPAVNQTQTNSSKSHKSSVPDCELLEKKKESKRFKYYYKYSMLDSAQEPNDGSSDAKSIVSDSYKFVSDPSEEYVVSREPKRNKGGGMDSEGAQIPQNAPKKWNRISSSRDFHLKNISEEPSLMSISSREQDYFIPLRGTKEYYCRVLSSSHSDYCFKIDKKPANSNISFQSKSTWDDGFYNKKFRYNSKSDFNLIPTLEVRCMPKSKSDVFLDESNAQKIIRSIFLEDTHPYVRNKRIKQRPRQYSRFKNVLKEILITSCKECQTVETQGNENDNDEALNTIVEDSIKIMEHKQKQFREIHKTIDNLERNIHSSKQVRPKTVDATVSSIFSDTRGRVIAKEPQIGTMTENRISKKTIAIQTSEDVAVKRINAAVGSPAESRQRRRARTSISIRKIHDVAIGDGEIKIPAAKPKTPRSRSQKAQTEHNNYRRTAAVSPIRIKEEACIQISSKSPGRKAVTPQTPKRKPLITKQAESKASKNITDNNLETNIKATHKKSPIRSRLHSTEAPSKTPQNVDTSQRPVPCLRVFRSGEKRPNVNKQSSDTQNNSICLKRSSTIKNVVAREESVIIAAAKRESDANPQKKIISEISFDGSVHESCFLHNTITNRFHTPVFYNNQDNAEAVIVNATTCNPQFTAQVKIAETKSSTSSSVSDAAPQVIRRSKSLVELSSHKSDLSRSKSDLCYYKKTLIVHTDDFLNAKDGSIISNNMEKYSTKPKFDGSSLDQYIGNKFISTLFLTKDYKGATISAYQKRKLYDQSIRQKMKKKFPKIDVRPQIFEVRFLAMDNEHKRSDFRAIKDNPISFNLEKKSGIHKRGHHSEPNNCINITPLVQKASDSKLEKCSLINKAIIDDDDNNNNNCPLSDEYKYQEKLISFCKKILNVSNIFEEDMLKNAACDCPKFSQNCSACKNITNIVNKLRSSLTNLSNSEDKSQQNVDDNSKLLLKQHHEVEELFLMSRNNISSDSTQSTEPIRTNSSFPTKSSNEETNLPVLLQPMSCPVLSTNSPSFEFLYEETFALENETESRNTIFATRPFDQTYTFSTSQYNAETPLFPENYGKTSGSIESGYASVKSKNCRSSSLTNFFKKPNIAALFKPPKQVSRDNVVRNIMYEQMAERCQLYAKKVRQCSAIQLQESKLEYQELPLNFLLGKDNKTLSIRSIKNDLESEREEIKEIIGQPIFDAAPEEPIKTNSYPQNGCKLILSNQSLNIENITYLGPEIFSAEGDDGTRASSSTLDISLDPINPLISNNDATTHTFLTSLIKINEKETEICNKLYHDDSFEKMLLAAVENEKNRNKKKGLFCKLFTKKTPKYQKDIVKVNLQVQEKDAVRLQHLAANAKKCFTMLADAVKVNENIDKEIKICGLLRLLERIENGDFEMVQNEENVNFEAELRFHIKEDFITLLNVCHKEAKKYKRRITENEIKLIKSFVIKHRIGLLSKTDIVASYISRGFIRTEGQLKAAVTFLMRSQSNEINVKEFEKYCKITK